MPSIAESKKQVKANLETEINHEAILSSLQDEIDAHNAVQDELRKTIRKHSRDRETAEHGEGRSSLKFRFKSDGSEAQKRKHGSGHRHRRKQRRDEHKEVSREAAPHPFPREPTDPTRDVVPDSTVAFRDSLFDALADDEGAAYWESVYDQPIHVYPRPWVETPQGRLEQMSDDEYVAYVQTKMWEKKNPDLVLERERKEQQKQKEEEEKNRRRQEYVRRKERAAWERAQNEGAKRHTGEDDDTYEYTFDMGDRGDDATKGFNEKRNAYRTAWTEYLATWDQLKHELLAMRSSTTANEDVKYSSRQLPWPVLSPAPVNKQNIEDFMRHTDFRDDGRTRLQLLKAERVRWHPDKVQQRFSGRIDKDTVKKVTAVFQVVDDLVEEERKRVEQGS